MSSARRVIRNRVAGLVAVGALVVGGLTASTAVAATPAQGSVSDTNTSASWTGGPFAAANVTGAVADQPSCDAPQSCDDFTLHVTTPAGYGAGHDLVVKVSWPNSAADFDVYLLDAQDKVVATAASSADPETVIVPPDSGTYTVRVVPFAPMGQSYSATAELRQKPASPAPGTDTPPGFHDYAAPSTLADANDAGEPSIGNDFNTGATIDESGLSTFTVRFDDSTSPAAAAWVDVSANASNGCPQGSTTSLDPILYTDHETGRTFESQLSGANSLTCYTDDGGQSWSPSTGGGIPSGVDHQTIGGGHFSADGVGGLGTYPNAVYYCSQDIATAFCAVSRDGGTTFGAGVPTYSLLDCGGLHGHIKVAPDGTAYLPNKGCGDNQAVVVSKDNGATWAVQPVPGLDSKPVAIAPFFGNLDGKGGITIQGPSTPSAASTINLSGVSASLIALATAASSTGCLVICGTTYFR